MGHPQRTSRDGELPAIEFTAIRLGELFSTRVSMVRSPPSPASSCSSSSSSSSLSSQPSPPSSHLPYLKPQPAPPVRPACISSSTKRLLLGIFVIGAFISWSLGAWEPVMIRVGFHHRLRPAVLLVGDSLTEKGLLPSSMGWATMLQGDCRRTVDVVCRGLAGYNTKWYLKHAMSIVQDEIIGLSYSPILITIWLGANDAALPEGGSSESHIPIDEYQENLAKLVLDFQAITPTSRILLITPPYVDDAVQKKNAKANKGDKKGLVSHSNEMAGKYARACVDTAKRVGVPVLDLHTYFNSLPKRKRKDLLEDGLHFNTTGNALMYEKLREIIEAEFEDVAQKLEHWQFPHYEDFIETDPWAPDSTIVDFTNVRVRR
ncbi:hypothetical protein F444_04061 [Phytophthora nicotianae P1976]|uniref:SGNH hydrolase-type esterase domain-containing protein n=1 Tax=Phytophthora nicotianae P1976 TaxID=1317066 RepID=A0A081AS20_PHYNI|nr:hypothetical protein F444_04061 [Phytophthora nicotianae P1976]